MENFKWRQAAGGMIFGIISAICVFIMIYNIVWKLLLFAILLGGILYSGIWIGIYLSREDD